MESAVGSMEDMIQKQYAANGKKIEICFAEPISVLKAKKKKVNDLKDGKILDMVSKNSLFE